MKRIAVALALLFPSVAQAQLGGTIALRHVNGRDPDPQVSQRSGVELRALWDSRGTRTLGWRAELAFAQAKYDRPLGANQYQISENSAELAGYLRARRSDGPLQGVYALAGPVISARLSCGALGGFVSCENREWHAVGYALGLGLRRPITQRRVLLLELRYSDGIVGTAQHSALSLGVGLGVR